MSNWNADDDPFARAEKTPSLKFEIVGISYKGIVSKKPELVHSRDFETGELAYWDAEKTQPKMSVVINLDVDGQARAIWAQKPSAMFVALGEAQEAAGELIAPGGTLYVKYTGDKKNPDKPRLSPAKQYAAKYEPPAPADPFAGSKSEEEPPF